MLFITRYKLLMMDWQGYLIAGFALVYMCQYLYEFVWFNKAGY